MKRIISLFLSMVVVLSLSFSTVALAAETPATSYEVSSDDLSQEIQDRINAGETRFVLSKDLETFDPDLGNEITVEVWVTRTPSTLMSAQATETVNWALSGRYYKVSNEETISNYGNHGSVDYTGTTVKNAIWDVYHDITYKYQGQYTATATDSEETVTNGKKFIGKYRLKNNSTGNYAEDAEIYIIVKKDGSWNSKGNYSAINVD